MSGSDMRTWQMLADFAASQAHIAGEAVRLAAPMISRLCHT